MKKTVNRNPRVAVTLSPDAMALLDELAAVLKQPKAALVSELVDAALPALKATVDAMRVVQQQPREAQRLIANYAARATLELSQQQLELDEAIDRRTVKGKRRRRDAGAT